MVVIPPGTATLSVRTLAAGWLPFTDATGWTSWKAGTRLMRPMAEVVGWGSKDGETENRLVVVREWLRIKSP
mgnify:CR=1 FL=1